MWEKRDELKEELLKEQGPDDFENSQPLQMTKDPKRQKWMPKPCHREKAEYVTVQLFAEIPKA